jgi:hypothetical protein
MTAIATASKSLELVKALKDLDKQLGEAELKAKSAALLSSLADVKVALVEARDEVLAKDKEIGRLKAVLAKRAADTVEHRGYRYMKGEDGGPRGDPYCPVCEARRDCLFRQAKRGNQASHISAQTAKVSSGT